VRRIYRVERSMGATRANQETASAYVEKRWLRHYDYWVPESSNFPRRSVYHILNLAATYFHDRPATAFLHAQLTFGELKQQADKLAAALAALGISKGDRVGVMLPNCPQYVISLFAITRLGAIVTNVNPIYTPREVELVVRDSGLRAMITLDLLVATIESIQARPEIEHLIVTSLQEYGANAPAATSPTPGTLSLASLIENAQIAGLPRVEIDAEQDVAALVYTGGTTGVSKGAMLTHYNLYAAAIQCALWGGPLSTRGHERFLLVIPYFHVYGLVVGALFGVWQGAMQILIPKFDPNLLLAATKQYLPTYFPGVPTLFIALLNHPDAEQSGLERIQRFNSGSAPLPVEVIDQFERLSGASIFEGWGMTETSALGTSTPALAERKPGSIGIPVTGTELKIVDLETGATEVRQGEDGELCIRGPQVMKGYWNRPEETAKVLRDGWLYTGDVARMDQDGYFFIIQRKKDLILVGGFNVYPNEIEDVLYTHVAVKETAVIGVPDRYKGEAVKAYIVLKEGASATEEEIAAHCKERLAKYKVPSLIVFTQSLPKSAVGKILRRELREAEENIGN
jgi:long-chain acyl-CoA synthetase